MPDPSLEDFLSQVRESCEQHATRKGYRNPDGNALGSITTILGIQAPHAIGEIIAKLIEFQATPRKVLCHKIAGWAWRLSLTVDEQDAKSDPPPSNKRRAGADSVKRSTHFDDL